MSKAGRKRKSKPVTVAGGPTMMETEARKRFVYVARDLHNKGVKIGVSANPAKRMDQLKEYYGVPFGLFWSVGVKFEDGIVLERAVHSEMRKTINHLRGERYLMEPETAVSVVKRIMEENGIAPIQEDIVRRGVEHDGVNFYKGRITSLPVQIYNLKPVVGF